MKNQLFSYIFFTLYLLALLRPMYPVLDYYVNYDYIIEQLCENRDQPILDCNGKCYVAKEIEKSQGQDNPHLLMPKMELEKYTNSNFIEFRLSKEKKTTNKVNIFFTIEKIKKGFLSEIDHPPSFA